MQVSVPVGMSALCAHLTHWDGDVQNLGASMGDPDGYMAAS